ncbi:MAG: tyrosine-type recombinase/integrase [Candidatus Marinimicrobia bacterium]|nr:tyrosine-type recombinase/integrase [Candidatus Neomarinimicrobiota bacterium]
MVEPLIRAGMKVNFSWLSDEERTTIGGSIDDYFKKFIKAKSIEGLAPKTLAGYDHMYAHLKKSLQVGRRANTLKLADFEEFKLYLVDLGRAAATVNRRCREFSVFLGYLYDHEIIRRRFKVKRTKEIEKINYIGEGGLRRIQQHIPIWMRPIIQFYSETGMRLMEPFHSVLFGKTLVVPSSKSKNRFVREVELNNDQVLVWKFLMTLPYKPQHYSRAFKSASRAAGLGENKFHNLRHFCGARLYAAHRDIQLIKLRLGHSSLSTTEKYQKFSLAQLKSAFPMAYESYNR